MLAVDDNSAWDGSKDIFVRVSRPSVSSSKKYIDFEDGGETGDDGVDNDSETRF